MNSEIVSYVIGVDAGTTSIKGVLMNSRGEIIDVAKQEYLLETGADETCELDAEVYWKVTCRIIRELIGKTGINPGQVSGISFSSQGETFIAVDQKGTPLRKAIVWLDNRSVDEAGQIRNEFGLETVMKITGQPEVVPTWTATKILWLKKHEHQLFKKVHKYLLVEDFLIFRMTGRFVTEHSVVSSTLLFDITKKKWWNEMLDYTGISESQLPDLLPSGCIVGNLTPEAAAETGLTTDTRCITGAYDHPAGAIGSGNINKGDVTLTVGASMAMCVALGEPVTDLSLKLPCQCHAIDGLYFLQPYAQTAGMVLKWFKDEFCKPEIDEAIRNHQDPYDLIVPLAAGIKPGADGLVMLPHLMGTGSPEFNPKATGVFSGIRMGMGKGHFIRAIIESVSLMIHHNLECMRKKGISVHVIHALGGASKSSLWNQVLADVTGLPVVTLKQTENASVGACLIAGTGTGIFKDLETACRASVKTQYLYEPDMPNHHSYKAVYNKYVELYNSLEKFW